MKTFKITIQMDLYIDYNGEHTANWNGYNEQQAIAQAFLYYAYQGARELKVLNIDIIEK